MKRFRPSLVVRLTVAFVISHALVMMLFLVAMWPFARNDEDAQIGPDAAIALIRNDLVIDRGGLVLPSDSELFALARRSPRLWFMIRGEGKSLDWGAVPEEARQIVAGLPA